MKLCPFLLQRNVSDAILVALKNTQRALLRYKNVNQGPVVIKEDNINMLVDRYALLFPPFLCCVEGHLQAVALQLY